MKTIGVSTVSQYAENPDFVFTKPTKQQRYFMKKGTEAHYEVAAGVSKNYNFRLVIGLTLFVFGLAGVAYVIL